MTANGPSTPLDPRRALRLATLSDFHVLHPPTPLPRLPHARTITLRPTCVAAGRLCWQTQEARFVQDAP